MVVAQDKLYAHEHEPVKAFEFDDDVACVFSDMVKRSVPGYEQMLATLSRLVSYHSQEKSNYYDLGCSLGAATLAMSRAINKAGCRIIAVDNSQAMISRCQQNIRVYQTGVPIETELSDIEDVAIDNAAVVVLNFTLQFIDVEKRQDLINRIYQGLKPGGLLFLSEKLQFTQAGFDKLMQRLHHDFKRDNGYSELEISQKRAAIENVLITDSYDTHRQRFEQAGFTHYGTWFQQYNFSSMVAVK